MSQTDTGIKIGFVAKAGIVRAFNGKIHCLKRKKRRLLKKCHAK
jgi:hypothetical protein